MPSGKLAIYLNNVLLKDSSSSFYPQCICFALTTIVKRFTQLIDRYPFQTTKQSS